MQFAEQQFELRLICGVSQPETGARAMADVL